MDLFDHDRKFVLVEEERLLPASSSVRNFDNNFVRTIGSIFRLMGL